METDNTNGRIEMLTQVVIGMAVESWRFGRTYDRLLTKLDAGGKKRYKRQFRLVIKKGEKNLEQAGPRVVYVEGEPFYPWLGAAPL